MKLFGSLSFISGVLLITVACSSGNNGSNEVQQDSQTVNSDAGTLVKSPEGKATSIPEVSKVDTPAGNGQTSLKDSKLPPAGSVVINPAPTPFNQSIINPKLPTPVIVVGKELPAPKIDAVTPIGKNDQNSKMKPALVTPIIGKDGKVVVDNSPNTPEKPACNQETAQVNQINQGKTGAVKVDTICNIDQINQQAQGVQTTQGTLNGTVQNTQGIPSVQEIQTIQDQHIGKK